MLEWLGSAALMAMQPAEPPTIVITGRGLEADDDLAGELLLDRADIDRSASQRIEDVLRSAAGLTSFRRSDSRSAHPTSQGLTLRGLGGNAASRVTVLLDGVPQADPFGGWIGFTALDSHSIDQIRVRRGGGIIGLAGTIDIDTRTIEAANAIDAALFAGSRQSLDARLFGGDRWAGGFVSLAGSFARGDGFIPVVEQDRGPADRRAPYRQGSARGRLVQALGQATEAQINLAYSSDHRDRGFDGSDNRQRATDAAIRLLGRGSMPWSALVYFQDRYFNSQFASLNGTRSISTLTLDQHVPSRGWGALAEIAPRLGPLETRLGAEWRGVSGYTEEEFRFVAESPTRQREAGGQSRTIGLFAITNWSAGGLSAAIEARLDHWAIDGGRLIETDLAGATLTNLNFDRRSGWEGSGRLALGRKIGSAMNVRAGAYGSWRLPTLNELYRPFRVGPDATAANGRLDPERLRGIEAGVDWKPAGTVKLSATMFANRLEGAIANVTLGAGPGTFPGVGFVAAGGIYRQRHNIDSILSRGLEVDASTERGPWQARLSYALTKARLRATGPGAALDGKQPAQVPRHSASASIGWSRSDLSADLAIRYVGAQFEDDINVRRLPGGLTVDSRASIPLGRRMAVELRGENLLDRRVLAGIAADGTRERALPRTFWLGLRLR